MKQSEKLSEIVGRLAQRATILITVSQWILLMWIESEVKSPFWRGCFLCLISAQLVIIAVAVWMGCQINKAEDEELGIGVGVEK